MKKNHHKSELNQVIKLLKECRIKAGKTQVDLAKDLRKPQSFVSKYESGERSLDLIEIRSICLVLKITLVEFTKELEERLNDTK